MTTPVWKLMPLLPIQSTQVVWREWQDGRQEYCLITAEKYLKWLEEGNTPEPADPAPAQDPKLVGIAFDGVMCSATRDDQNGLLAVLAAFQLQGANFQPTRFQFVNGNSLVLNVGNFQNFLATWMPFRQSFFEVN